MTERKNGKYGINITKWCKEHEAFMEEVLAGTGPADDPSCLLALHEKKLSWLMHERLIHLIVMFIVTVLALFAMSVLLLVPETLPASLPLFIIVFVLLIFYVRHYFFLENTVQRWYRIDEAVSEKLHETACK